MGVDSHLHNSPGAAISKRSLVAGVLFAIGLASLVLPFLALAGLAPSAFLARSHQLVVAHGAFAVTLAFAYGSGYRPARAFATVYLIAFAILSADVLLGFGIDIDERELAASLAPGLVAALVCAAAAAAFNLFSDDVKRAFSLRR